VEIIHELTRKPWLAQTGKDAGDYSGKSLHLSVEKLGLRVFLAVVTVLFSLVVVIYSDRMSLSDWRPLREPWSLWVNTGLLILASVAFQWALINARRGTIDGVKTGLNAAGVLTLVFLVGQIWVAQQLTAAGYYANESPAVAFLYLMSTMHGMHLLGGLFVWYRATARMRRGADAAQLYPSVELCAIYWHYLLGIWLVLFGLLLLT
jgi:cytochrome c oxidase subunit 3